MFVIEFKNISLQIIIQIETVNIAIDIYSLELRKSFPISFFTNLDKFSMHIIAHIEEMLHVMSYALFCKFQQCNHIDDAKFTE